MLAQKLKLPMNASRQGAESATKGGQPRISRKENAFHDFLPLESFLVQDFGDKPPKHHEVLP